MIEKKDRIIQELEKIIEDTYRQEKHIGYHILPEQLVEGNSIGFSNKYVFYERERLALFCKHIEFKDKSILDIGCNTAYFLFSFLELGAKKVVGYEGKRSAARLARRAIELLRLQDLFEYRNRYYEFTSGSEKYDVILLLNVLHHIGDDYGRKGLNIKMAKERIIDNLNTLAKSTQILVFQMGYNWQGNINNCLFDKGTKSEMISYIKNGTASCWDIFSITVPELIGGNIVYEEINKNNIDRRDELGEFLNRPIFIMKSKKMN